MAINMTFTGPALAYIQKMLAKSKGNGLRLSIKKTGCSGHSYLPSIVEEINSNDLVIEREGIRIYIDTAWAHLFENVCVDYQEETTGLKQKKLIFMNPNESSRCGCGESFHVEKNN